MNSDSIKKKDQHGDQLDISYSMKENGELHSTLEQLKFSYAETFINGQTTYIIKELVNDGLETRYYAIQNLLNTPGAIKVTFFCQMTSRVMRTRGENLY